MRALFGMARPLSRSRVAGPVPPFVVAAGDLLGDSDLGNVALRQDFGADDRVGCDEVPFSLLQRAFAEENLLGDAELADVVQAGRTLDGAACIRLPTNFRGEQGREPADAIAVLSGDVLTNIRSDGHSLEHFLACAIEFTLKYLYLQLRFCSIKFGPVCPGSKHGAIKIAFERREVRNGRVQVNCLEMGAQIAHCFKRKFTFTDCVVGLR